MPAKNASDGKLLSDKNAYTRTAILSLNFLYKSDHGKWFNKAANNLLLTGAVSYGRQNNFNKLKSSEFKAVEKTDSAANNASYTRTESYSVYTDTPTIFKEYDAFNTYFEAVKLFGENGTIGLRNRLTWEMPEEKSNVNNQVNWEFGILFNTTTKKDQDISKFSVELFVNFKDLGGKNVLEKDLEQKFYERHTVGVRTNLPFRFLSL